MLFWGVFWEVLGEVLGGLGGTLWEVWGRFLGYKKHIKWTFWVVPEACRTFPAGSGEEILRRIRISGPKFRIQASRGQTLGKTTAKNSKMFGKNPGEFPILIRIAIFAVLKS